MFKRFGFLLFLSGMWLCVTPLPLPTGDKLAAPPRRAIAFFFSLQVEQRFPQKTVLLSPRGSSAAASQHTASPAACLQGTCTGRERSPGWRTAGRNRREGNPSPATPWPRFFQFPLAELALLRAKRHATGTQAPALRGSVVWVLKRFQGIFCYVHKVFSRVFTGIWEKASWHAWKARLWR